MSTELLPDPTYPMAGDSRDSATLAYVVVPHNLEPKAYIRQALDTGRLSCVSDRGEPLHRVMATAQVLAAINAAGWPQQAGELGPALLLVNLPIHNQLVAVGTVLGSGDDSGLGGEYELATTLRAGTGTVALRARADQGSLALTLDGSEPGQSRLTLTLNHEAGQARSEAFVEGDTLHRSDGRSQLEAGQRLTLRVGTRGADDDTQNQMELSYEKGVGLRYIDEWNNEISAGPDGITLRRPGQHRTLALSDAGLDLGSEQAAEPALLGDTTMALVSELVDLLLAASYASNAGPTVPGPLNGAGFQALKKRLDTAKSQTVRLD